MEIYKEYHEINSKIIRCVLRYRKDPYSIANNEYVGRGYVMGMVPVERSADGKMESFTAFTGFNILLVEVARASKKAEEAALKLFHAKKIEYLEKFKEV